MKTELENLIEVMYEGLVCDLRTLKGNKLDDLLYIVLEAFNHYQEVERDGVDYLFNIENMDDVKCCIHGGMTTKQIADVYNEYKDGRNTGYFFFGQNYDKVKPIKTRDELINLFIGTLHDVLLHVVCYPCGSEAYKALYGYCISGYMINSGMI